MTEEKLTISKLAKLCGIGVETIRYYQRVGLIETPPKPVSGYREYPRESVRKLKFIQRAKELGFTLAEIKELLLLEGGDCRQTQGIASQKIMVIREKINYLQSMATTLEALLQSCRTNPGTSVCPIIDTLSKD